MSGKKKQSDKKKNIEKKIDQEESKRKLIPSTAGKLPLVSKSMPQAASGIPSISKTMPQAAGAVPLVSKEIPSVSKAISLVSAVPRVTIPRHWGIMPRKKWGDLKMLPNRIRKIKRPKDIGLLRALGETIVSPVMGTMKIINGIGSTFKKQADSETEVNNG